MPLTERIKRLIAQRSHRSEWLRPEWPPLRAYSVWSLAMRCWLTVLIVILINAIKTWKIFQSIVGVHREMWLDWIKIALYFRWIVLDIDILPPVQRSMPTMQKPVIAVMALIADLLIHCELITRFRIQLCVSLIICKSMKAFRISIWFIFTKHLFRLFKALTKR